MGGVQHYLDEMEARGWADVGTNICEECVSDEALIAAVGAHGGTEPCDYCTRERESRAATAPIELILELVVDGLRQDYDDPNEEMGWDHGWVGPTHWTGDLLFELGVTDSGAVHAALVDAIFIDVWCQRGPYEATPTQAMQGGWSAFRDFVKHRRRFTFLTTDDSTAVGAGDLPMHAVPAAIADAVLAAGLVRELEAGSEWWRVRPHNSSAAYSSAIDLGTPPDTIARDNRMTPKGIGAFYGASSAAGARAEVAGYAGADQVGTLARFSTLEALQVVDLRELPPVPSLFDPEQRGLRPAIQFLEGFVADATAIAEPSDTQNLDYVPTQVLAETFRFDLPVDGILWRSSKDASVTSCVLFVRSSELAELGTQTDGIKIVMDPTTVERIEAPL